MKKTGVFFFLLSTLEAGPSQPVDLTSRLIGAGGGLGEHRRFLGMDIPSVIRLKLSEKDEILADIALQKTLEEQPSFSERYWHNLSNDHKGYIQAFPSSTVGTRKCRKFSMRLNIDDERYELKGHACRNGKLNWEIVPN